MGQRVELVVTCSNGDVSDCEWTVEGYAVKDYVIIDDDTTHTAEVTFLLPEYLKDDSISFYWTKPNESGYTVSVKFKLTVDGKTSKCSKSMVIKVMHVDGHADFEMGVPRSLIDGGIEAVLLSRPAPIGYGAGITFTAYATTPPEFISGSDKREWQFTQIVESGYRSFTVRNPAWADNPCKDSPNPSTRGSYTLLPKEGLPGVDIAFAYPAPPGLLPPPWSANGATHLTYDSPGIHARTNNYLRIREDDAFHTYLMYHPPGTAGVDVIWVPLAVLAWGFSYCADAELAGNLWSIKSQETYSDEDWQPYPDLPTWVRNVPEVTATNQTITCQIDPGPCES